MPAYGFEVEIDGADPEMVVATGDTEDQARARVAERFQYHLVVMITAYSVEFLVANSYDDCAILTNHLN